jgi:hypothetical protein
MRKRRNNEEILRQMLEDAPPEILVNLVLEFASEQPEIRRECFDYLKEHMPVSKLQASGSEGDIILDLWSELEPDLEDLDSYGGGDSSVEDDVGDLLSQIRDRLDSKNVGSDYRREILDQVLPYIKSGNAGMDDMLYDVAYAACYDDSELRNLAEAFEAMKSDWKTTHAREIYRRIGDREKYLELRLSNMEYGGDYHDLATFYWEAGEKEKALQITETGLKKGKGRMDELRMFAAERAEESGDHEHYLAIRFAQTVDNMTLQNYESFQKLCSKDEWAQYEPRLLGKLKDAWQKEQIKIRMHRREYDLAVAVLLKGRYPTHAWEDGYEIQIAEKLEKNFPEEILKYYLSGLGNLTFNTSREEYARKAGVMAKVRRLLVEIMGDEKRWKVLAAKVKKDNLRRPAFQQEFAKVLPDWPDLK